MKNRKKYLFHPYEIIFSGYSGSGKTTLIEKLMKKYSINYNIAFIKHDIHKFDMDKKGKDTYRIYNAGAKSIFISSENGSAYLSKEGVDSYNFKSELTRYDFVVIEGYKEEFYPKYFITTLKNIGNIDFNKDKYKNLLAIILDEKISIEKLLKINSSIKIKTIFYRNDIDEIYNHSISYIKDKAKKIKLNGLVLVGGKSRRMGKDKSALDYHGKSQAEYLYEILEPLVDRVLISSRKEQNSKNHLKNLNYVNDVIEDIGPLGGILSAMLTDREVAWLVVACDMPNVTKQTIQKLIENRDFFKTVTTFKGDRDFEPLIAIYEPKSFNNLINGVIFKEYSIRKLLKNSKKKLLTTDKNEIININCENDLKVQ